MTAKIILTSGCWCWYRLLLFFCRTGLRASVCWWETVWRSYSKWCDGYLFELCFFLFAGAFFWKMVPNFMFWIFFFRGCSARHFYLIAINFAVNEFIYKNEQIIATQLKSNKNINSNAYSDHMTVIRGAAVWKGSRSTDGLLRGSRSLVHTRTRSTEILRLRFSFLAAWSSAALGLRSPRRRIFCRPPLWIRRAARLCCRSWAPFCIWSSIWSSDIGRDWRERENRSKISAWWYLQRVIWWICVCSPVLPGCMLKRTVHSIYRTSHLRTS